MSNPLAKYFKERICSLCTRSFKPTVGNQRVCKNCKQKADKDKKKEWAFKNRAKLNQKSREWYWTHLKKAREIRRQWNNNPKNTAKRKYDNSKKKQYSELDRKKIISRGQANRIMRRMNPNKICSSNQQIVHSNRIEVHHIDLDPFNNNN